jgi:hypothetical protein
MPASGSPKRHSETARQIVHMSMGGFALLLRWLTWWQAVALAAGALLFNLFVLPRVGARSIGPAIASAAARHRLLPAGGAAPAARFRAGPTSRARRGASSPSATASRRSRDARSAAALAVEPREDRERQRRVRRRRRRAGVSLAWWCRPAVPPPHSRSRPGADAPRVARRWSRRSGRLDDNLSVAPTAGGVAVACVAGVATARRGAAERRRACRGASR